MTDITINTDPTNDQLKAAVRAVLIALGGYIAGKGWLPADLVAPLVSLALVAGPVLWGQLEARAKKAQLVAVAAADPASVVMKP